MKLSHTKILQLLIALLTLPVYGAEQAIPQAPELPAEVTTAQPEKPQPEQKKEAQAKSLQKEEIGELTLGMLYPQHLRGEDSAVVHPSRTLLIFLDDSETGFNAITRHLTAALYQEAGPILVSGSLLQNVFKQRMDQKTYEVNKTILKTTLEKDPDISWGGINDKLSGKESDSLHEFDTFILTMINQSFNLDNWFIAEVNSALFLLIPKKLLPRGSSSINIEGFSERELNLGLKIDHMKRIESNSLQEKFSQYNEPTDNNYFIDALWDQKAEKYLQETAEQRKKTAVMPGAPNLSSIFVTRVDYAQLRAENKQKFIMPQWSIYIDGHGSIGRKICGLSITAFKTLLQFLDTKILTKLFIYSSCDAAGTNTDLVYKDLQQVASQKAFPFPIILEGYTDVTIASYPPLPKLYENNIVLTFDRTFNSPDGNGFINQTNKNEPIALSTILKSIFESLRTILEARWERLSQIKTINYPMIRPANREQFISLMPGIEIGKAMMGRTKPLDVVAAAKQKGVAWDTTMILLQVNNVSFPLIFKGQVRIPTLFSAIPGETTHIIDRIESAYPLGDILSKIIKPRYGAKKTFLIRTFIDNSGEKQQTFTNVIVDSFDTNKLAYATETSTYYVIDKYDDMQPTSENYIKKYSSLLLSQAMQENNLKEIKSLLQQGAEPDKKLLDELRTKGKNELIDILVTHLIVKRLGQVPLSEQPKDAELQDLRKHYPELYKRAQELFEEEEHIAMVEE